MTRSNPDPTSRAVDELADLLRGVRDHHRATGEPVTRDNAIGKLADAARRAGKDSTAQLLDNIATGRRHDTREPETPATDPTTTWQQATRDAAHKLCMDAGRHQYQVVGALIPTKVVCPRCGRSAEVAAFTLDGPR